MMLVAAFVLANTGMLPATVNMPMSNSLGSNKFNFYSRGVAAFRRTALPPTRSWPTLLLEPKPTPSYLPAQLARESKEKDARTKAAASGRPLETADDVIFSLELGNRRYMSRLRDVDIEKFDKEAVGQLMQDPIAPSGVRAVVVSCARCLAPVEAIFDTAPGALHSLRVGGNVCRRDDGVIGCCEFALEQYAPPLLLVLGNERNDMVETAVARVMREAGRSDAPDERAEGVEMQGNGLMEALLSSAAEALAASPSGGFEELCKAAALFNVWNSVEALLTASRDIGEKVHGAYFELAEGRVRMLGAHPSQAAILEESVSAGACVREACEPAVPAEEALAALYAGNARYVSGGGGGMAAYDGAMLRRHTSEGGHNPMCVVLGCSDSRAPAEMLFDSRPGDLFVVRVAGNNLPSEACATVGAAELALSMLSTKLIVVTGHTHCGAVAKAVAKAVADQRSGADQHAEETAGAMGEVLASISEAAEEAISRLPDAELKEQVALATELNVLSAMRKLMEVSDLIRSHVISGEVMVVGCVYDIRTGFVKWLGQHPRLAQITGAAPHVPYNYKPVILASAFEGDRPKLGKFKQAKDAIARILEGNDRFVRDAPMFESATPVIKDPFAIVLSMAEERISRLSRVYLLRVPVEQIVDATPADVYVQRMSGGIAGRGGATLLSSLEYANARWRPPVLLVIAASRSEIVASAIEQVSGSALPSAPKRAVLERVMVAAMYAKMQVDGGRQLSRAGRELKLRQLTAEIHALRTVEVLLRSSDALRASVAAGGLEIHAAVVDEESGKLSMLGEHPQMDELAHETNS